MAENPFEPPSSQLDPNAGVERPPTVLSRGLCDVCRRNAVGRLRALFFPRCANCGCRLKQNFIFGFGAHLASSSIIYVSTLVSISSLSPLPLLVGFGAGMLITAFGRFVPDEKDPETRIRMRMYELKAKQRERDG